jgi:membrane protein DedA with SNARE-associated domain/membrane-associated phospholipid phosphatase
MVIMVSSLTQLVATYGYVIVTLFIVLESAGLPLPGETALLVAAAYAGTGQLSIFWVIAVAAIAAIVGDAGGYWLGRRGGRAFLEHYGKWLRLNEKKLNWIEDFFARHGPKTVFFGRFIGVLRTYSALFAGISKMPYGTFTLFNALGGILWAILFGLLGYVFGQNLAVVERVAAYVGWGVLLLVGILLGAVLVWYWLANHQAQLVARCDALLSYPPIARLRVRYARELQWIRQRLTPGQYLGLHVTLGLLVAAGCLWLFGGVAQDVIAHDPLVRFDQSLATTLHSWATPTATTMFVLISDLGEPVVLVLGIVVAVFYGWRRQWLYLGTWLVALGGGEVLNLLIKHLVARPRPVFAQPLIPESGYGFPSGHAVLSLIAYGLLAYFAFLGLRTWRARSAIICAATVLVLIIGFSRLYLGVHYFSDVAGGYAAGGVWLSTCITGMELIRRGEISERWIQRLQRWNGQHGLV